jgi:hypothetical protein
MAPFPIDRSDNVDVFFSLVLCLSQAILGVGVVQGLLETVTLFPCFTSLQDPFSLVFGGLGNYTFTTVLQEDDRNNDENQAQTTSNLLDACR